MKKRLCVILIAAFAALMVFAFAGCSSSSDSDETSSTDQEEQATTSGSSSEADEESDDKASDDKESDEKDSDDKESDEKDSKKSDKEPSGEELLLATGGEAGTYYAFGTVIAQYAEDSFDLPVSALSSEGSQANIESLENGDVDLAFCQNDVATYAYEGENLYDKKIDNFSVVAGMYEEQVQIVTTDESIQEVSDLEGKAVSLGAENSGVLQNALDILDSYGLTEDDVDAVYQDFSDSADSLKDGDIDAAFVVAGAPTTAITDLADSSDVYLVSMDEEHISDLMEKSPYYTEATIEADTYTNQDEDVQTIGVLAVILAADTVSDDDVYVFTEALFDGAEEQADAHDKYKELDVDDAASITSIPYHPGAAEYYKDQGITVESKASSDSKDSKDSEASDSSSKASDKDSKASDKDSEASDKDSKASDKDSEDEEASDSSSSNSSSSSSSSNNSSSEDDEDSTNNR